MKKFALLLSMLFMVSVNPLAQTTYIAPDSIQRSTQTINIRLKTDNHTLRATLNKSQAARDFINQLPLTLTLEDYANAEKASTLPHKLRITDSPAGSSAKAGDIAYYAPWGNLVLFYQNAPYANGLVILGHINSDISVLHGKGGNFSVTIENTP